MSQAMKLVELAQTAPVDAMNALTIRLDDELFAVEAHHVREILELVPITEVPNAPEFVGGLINVRGRVVPLADLRVMFGMNRAEPDEDTRIVVMEVDMDGEPAIVGILADKVHDVTDIEAASIEEAPKVGMRWRPEFIKGIGKRNGGFIIIPNMERIFEISGARTAPVAASEERSAS
ncbi:purine-binding chemotaxis protein CheW [Devosia subaequoris]|uniref:Purine-binding chemotaxis protein CheW n=1 Tax=Devosia subaequoris TaxID=395930 RepID=A0A7W6NCI1_9HYPH|nr:chemotaxis protein CheW [Devosia subaequoris]MBB4052799.1 purine-binding chemotaxis protein CheW [Devosia subaequoris]MCP1209950.1 chemotaxis protein CheW [Devosia subaequoris]